MKATREKELILKYKDFNLTPCDHARDRFDLTRTTKNQKTGKDFNKLIGYGYRFDEAIHQIISEELSESSEISTLKGYVDAYKEFVKKIKDILK